MKLTTIKKIMLADLQTPVSIYLKVRDIFPKSALLESSDYHSSENSFSYIGIEPIASFTVKGDMVTEFISNKSETYPIAANDKLHDILDRFIKKFEITGDKCRMNGFLGYTAYNAISHFENIPCAKAEAETEDIPDMIYILYKYIIEINHLRNEMTIAENLSDGETSKIDDLVSVLDSRNFPVYDFQTEGDVSSPITDEEYKKYVEQGIAHCLRGDVFQIVLSRRFEQRFSGDDFKVYRTLRSVNPSPYLFYFDFGSFRIFGSSPETHVKIEGNTATIDPIAGTVHRTGDDSKDAALAKQLLADPKENAEHVMLVDLARNDLSRNTTGVYVKKYKEIQYYSHVIHMVSRVCGTAEKNANRIKLFTDTFPAGTLSGAPKVKAMQLINSIEKHQRGVYGGCIGYIGIDGNLNQAITIRTFLSKNNKLYFQAGAGIVAKSQPENELQEVNSKLGALRKAIEIANNKKI